MARNANGIDKMSQEIYGEQTTHRLLWELNNFKEGKKEVNLSPN
jgi:hypothetical protein